MRFIQFCQTIHCLGLVLAYPGDEFGPNIDGLFDDVLLGLEFTNFATEPPQAPELSPIPNPITTQQYNGHDIRYHPQVNPDLAPVHPITPNELAEPFLGEPQILHQPIHPQRDHALEVIHEAQQVGDYSLVNQTGFFNTNNLVLGDREMFQSDYAFPVPLQQQEPTLGHAQMISPSGLVEWPTVRIDPPIHPTTRDVGVQADLQAPSTPDRIRLYANNAWTEYELGVSNDENVGFVERRRNRELTCMGTNRTVMTVCRNREDGAMLVRCARCQNRISKRNFPRHRITQHNCQTPSSRDCFYCGYRYE